MPSSQSKSSRLVSRKLPPTATPALLTITSAAGAWAWTASANAPICARSETSTLRTTPARGGGGGVAVGEGGRPAAELGGERIEPRLVDIAGGDPRALLCERERGG